MSVPLVTPAANGRTFNPNGERRMLRPEDAAQAVGVPPATLRRWIAERRLPTYREGRSVWVSEDHVMDLEYELRVPGVEARRQAMSRSA